MNMCFSGGNILITITGSSFGQVKQIAAFKTQCFTLFPFYYMCSFFYCIPSLFFGQTVGLTTGTLTIGGKVCPISTWSDTQIVCSLPIGKALGVYCGSFSPIIHTLKYCDMFHAQVLAQIWPLYLRRSERRHNPLHDYPPSRTALVYHCLWDLDSVGFLHIYFHQILGSVNYFNFPDVWQYCGRILHHTHGLVI